MTSAAVRTLLLLFLATLGVTWPELPGNSGLPDLLFIPLVIALLIDGARPALRASQAIVWVYLLGAVPSILLSPEPAAGWLELVRESYLVAIYVAIGLAIDRGYLRTVAVGLALSGAGLAVLGIAFGLVRMVAPIDMPAMGVVMPLPYIGSVLRLQSLTASQSMLACVLTMALPFALALAEQSPSASHQRRWLATAGAMVLAALLTFSHSVAGLVVAAVIAAWPRLQVRPGLKRAAGAAAVIAGVGFNFAATVSVRSVNAGAGGVSDPTQYHYAVGSGRIELDGITVSYQVMSYLRLKQLALEAWLAQPIAGIGLDRFHAVTRRAFEEGRLTIDYREIDPHSALPGRLAETGAIGGATLCLLWIVFARRGRHLLAGAGPDAWMARATVAGLAGLLINGINADVMNFRFVWVGLGILGALTERREALRQRHQHP